METESKIKINYTTEYIVVAGYLIFFCSLIAACLGFVYINQPKPTPQPVVVNEFATFLPPLTPSPHISPETQPKPSMILFQEDFNNNQNHWLDSEDDTKEQINGGTLFFQSLYDGEYAIIDCESCPYLETPYYLETRLSTNFVTDEEYGIVFRRDSSFEDFYLFLINPESRKYYLYHHTLEEWSLRTSGESSFIHSYPEITTLGIYANDDYLELYIEGNIVDSYVETGTSFHPGFFGLYVDNSWFGVYADKITIYGIGE